MSEKRRIEPGSEWLQRSFLAVLKQRRELERRFQKLPPPPKEDNRRE